MCLLFCCWKEKVLCGTGVGVKKKEHIVFGRQIRQVLFSHVIFRPCVLEDWRMIFMGVLLQNITCTHISELEGQREYDFLLLLH